MSQLLIWTPCRGKTVESRVSARSLRIRPASTSFSSPVKPGSPMIGLVTLWL